MAVRNAMPFLPEAIQSIQAQSENDWELLIGDDASSDGSSEYLHSLSPDPRIRLFRSRTAQGAVLNKAHLLANASGRFITQQDADDISEPYRLQRQMKVFSLHPQTGIVGCGMTLIDLEGKICGLRTTEVDRHYRPGDVVDFPFWFAPMMARRALFDCIGYVNPYFNGVFGEDNYWGLRAAELSEIRVIADPLYRYRQHGSSETTLLDTPRKLAMIGVLEHLKEQRRLSGTDDLEQGRLPELHHLEASLLADPRYVSSHYRAFAARAIDHDRLSDARRLLGAALRRWPWSLATWRTALYYLRRAGRH